MNYCIDHFSLLPILINLLYLLIRSNANFISTFSPPISSRKLDVGDFTIVNEVFKDFRLPIDISDESLEIEAGPGTIFVDITNLLCYNINIGDIILSYDQPNKTSVDYLLNVIKIDVECDFDYTYRAAPIFRGEGSAVILARENNLNINVLFSQPASGVAPNIVDASNCFVDIGVEEATFNGGIVAFILNLVENAILGYINNIVADFVCDLALGLDEQAMNLLANITMALEPFLIPLDEVDPLEPEIQLNESLSSMQNLINLQEPNNSSRVASAVDFLLEQASDILSNERDDPESPNGNGTDLGINVLLRSFLLNDDRSVSFNTSTISQLNNGTLVDVTNTSLIDAEIRLDYLTLNGLDTFTSFIPFEEIGSYTIQAAFAWEYIEIKADLFVAIGPPNGDERVEEHIELSTLFTDLNFTLASLLAVSEEVGEIEIGQILEKTKILPCFFDSVAAINISTFLASIGSVNDLSIQDFESPGLGRVLDIFLQGLYELYDEIFLIALQGAFQTTIRERLNTEIEELVLNATCDIAPKLPRSEIIDFRDLFLSPSESAEIGGNGSEPYGDIGATFRGSLDKFLNQVDNVTGIPKINNFIEEFITDQSGIDGTLLFNETLLDLSGDFSIEEFGANFVLKVENLRFENIDTIRNPITLLQPTNRSGYEMYNEVGLGMIGRPLRVTTTVLLQIENDENINIRDKLDISLTLQGAQLSLTFLAKVMAQRLFSFPIIDILDLNCWLSTIPAPLLSKQGTRLDGIERTAGILDLELLLDNLTINVDCKECTSEAFYELSDLLQSDKNAKITTSIANTLFDYVTELLDGEFLQIFIDRALNQAPARCPHHPSYDPTFEGIKFEPFETIDIPSDSLLLLLIVTLTVFGVLFLAFSIRSFIKFMARRRHVAWTKIISSVKAYRIYCEQKEEDKTAFYLKNSTSSMFSSEHVPTSVRYGVPFVIFVNIGLFLSGHFNLGGAVSVFINFAGEDITIDRLFSFSVVNAIIQLWEGGAIELAVMIAIFSGIWPYTKQIITLVAWFLPPQKLSIKRRESIFIWLDALAKWSSVDIFFLVVFIVAFNIRIQSPESAILPNDFYSVDIQLVPLWGLYATLIAQILSQLSSHVIIHYHRKLVKSAIEGMKRIEVAQISDVVNDNDQIESGSLSHNHTICEAKERLHEHEFLRPHRELNETLKLRPGINGFIVLATIVLVAMCIFGCLQPAFSFEQLGFLGVVIEFGQNFKEAENHFGVFTIFKTLMDQASFGSSIGTLIGMFSIAILVLLTVLIVPIIQACALLYLWFASISSVRRNRIQILIEILSSWQYIEVFLIAIMVSTWQLGQTSEYLINSYCGGLEDEFSMLVNYGILSNEDAQCFRLRGNIREGSYILLATAFLLGIINTFITQAVVQYNYDRKKERQITNSNQDSTITSQELTAEIDMEEIVKKIKPPPVLFTDIFRWFLRGGTLKRRNKTYNVVNSNEIENASINETPPNQDISVKRDQEIKVSSVPSNIFISQQRSTTGKENDIDDDNSEEC